VLVKGHYTCDTASKVVLQPTTALMGSRHLDEIKTICLTGLV